MSGFLHALSETQPADSSVAPLKPRLWRSDFRRAPVGRARRLGARYSVVLSDLWGYPKDGWAGKGPPWRDLRAWERFVRGVARQHRGEDLIWDIWNEPDSKEYWSGGRRRFLRTYAVADRALRAELGPGAQIGGPSLSGYIPEYLRAFLDRCLRERCRVSFIAWHEAPRPWVPLRTIPAHLADARQRFLGDPRYAALGLREIHVNEFTGETDRDFAGEAVAYLSGLERGGADLAVRACWTPPDCSPAGLDGLLSPTDGRPRATWWVHRWYSDGADARVASESTDESIAVLASVIGGRAQVLLGHAPPRGEEASTEPEGASGQPLRAALELSGVARALDGADRVRVRAQLVPSVGEAPVPRPRTVLDDVVELDEETLRLVLPPLGPHEAMLVSVASVRD